MIKPEICRKETSYDNVNAGWYVPNSVRIGDLVPVWRSAGGGVLSSDLTKDLKAALDVSISYSSHRIAEAEGHINKLQKAKDQLSG